MKKIQIKIFNESNNPNPQYAKINDTGCDAQASMTHTKANYKAGLGRNWIFDDAAKAAIIRPGGRALIGTGIFCEIPDGYGIAIRPRSGTALKKGITVCNAPGTIDAGYRNEIGIILINHSGEEFIVKEGDKVAQFVLEEVIQIEWDSVEDKKDLSSSDRGQGGFGHTGS